jgi:transcriptional regulator GlxA family with amidase domain
LVWLVRRSARRELKHAGDLGKIQAMFRLLRDRGGGSPQGCGVIRSGGKEYHVKAVEFMATHLHEEITLGQLARRSGCSRSGFAALFRAQTGQPPMKYLESLRLAQARQVLEYTSQTLARIATMSALGEGRGLIRGCLRSECRLAMWSTGRGIFHR